MKMKSYFVNFKKFLNEKGFSLIEVSIASLILSVVGVMAAKGLGIAYNQVEQLEVHDSKLNLSSNILNTLVTNATNFQIDYGDTNPTVYLNDPEKFTRAWDTDGRDSTLEGCPTCRGRYDFIFKTVPNNKSLSELWVGIYHPEAIGKNKLKIYRRVVGTK